MRIEFELHNELGILRIKGRFTTGSNADYLCARNEVIRAGLRKIVLDLADVPHLDSTGLSFVVGLHNAVRSVKGRLVLINANPRVREVLALTRLDGIIPVFDEERAAVAALGGKASLAVCV